MMLRRLRKRLTAYNALVSGAILLAIVLGALLFTRAQFRISAQNAFAHSADTIAYQLQSDSLIRHDYLRNAELSHAMLLYIEDGGTPFRWGGAYVPPTPRETLVERAVALAAQNGLDIAYAPLSSRNFTGMIRGDRGDAYRLSVWSLPSGKSWCSVVVLMDTREEETTTARIALIFAACLIAGIAMQALFSYRFAGRAIRPVERAQAEQRAFVAAASHELRTPLAVIRASADALPKASGAQAEDFIAIIRRQGRHMARLVEDMLLLASADERSIALTVESVETKALLQETLDAFAPLAMQKGIRLCGGPFPVAHVWADREKLRQILSVLLDNALEYTPAEGTVLLSCEVAPHAVSLSVADDGPGIPASDRERIFVRFFRADKGRSRQRGHYGLGLSIATELAALQGACIEVSDSPSGGALFSVRLKRRLGGPTP